MNGHHGVFIEAAVEVSGESVDAADAAHFPAERFYLAKSVCPFHRCPGVRIRKYLLRQLRQELVVQTDYVGHLEPIVSWAVSTLRFSVTDLDKL